MKATAHTQWQVMKERLVKVWKRIKAWVLKILNAIANVEF